jgi:EAL domain-containing protein (putative c-di-GMP-specific phosphodiesterase class I)
VTAAIVALAHTLGLQAIAEGVETDAQLEVLRHLSCDAAQGFLFSRAVSGECLAAMLAE